LNPVRGELWWATLDPIVGSEQAGRRPVLIVQNDAISSFTSTVVAVPLTTVLRRAKLPSSALVPALGTGLPQDSVALCHQLRVLDKARLVGRIGLVSPEILLQVEYATLFTLGISLKRGQGGAA
jgi:mRNA interferase MazF